MNKVQFVYLLFLLSELIIWNFVIYFVFTTKSFVIKINFKIQYKYIYGHYNVYYLYIYCNKFYLQLIYNIVFTSKINMISMN